MTPATRTPQAPPDELRAQAETQIAEARAYLKRNWYPEADRFVASLHVIHTGYGTDATWLCYELRDPLTPDGQEDLRRFGPVVMLPHSDGPGHGFMGLGHGRCATCSEPWEVQP